MIRSSSLMVLLALLSLLPSTAGGAVDRAEQALRRRRGELTTLLRKKGLPFPPRQVLLRAFKRERVLEVWAGEGRGPLRLVLSLPFCAASGELGPKRRSGDGQVPEGFYTINRVNPWSAFYLSLGLDYPNAADRRTSRARHLGGDIFLHGGCASIGCIAVTDEGIEPVYLLVSGARSRGQSTTQVHIFPARLDEKGITWLRSRFASRPELLSFWESLRPAYLQFERTHTAPRVRVDAGGRYRLDPSPLASR